MTYDLKITGGTVVDGTGARPFRADVGIRDGVLVAVGEAPEPARVSLDAEGAIVTPGFIDLHTHYDGQAVWDQDLLPSAVHGVTTAVIGNCGVGFAPVHDHDHERLIRLMEGVEDIPGAALAEGLTYSWRSFPEYMDALASRPRTIDLAAQVPHDALRLHVMGDRAADGLRATDLDILTMRDLCREALEAGAFGFSTGRTDNHRTKDGQWTPSSEAETAELAGIASAFDGLGYGVLQAVSDFDMLRNSHRERFDDEFDVLETMARAAGGRPLSISLLEREQAPDQWRHILRRARTASTEGVPIRAQVAARPIGLLLGLDASFHPFMGFPSYKEIAHLPLAERARQLRNKDRSARLLSERSEPLAGDGSPIPPLADFLLARIDLLARRLYVWANGPDYEPFPEASIANDAARRGVPVLQAVLDALVADDGRALIYFPLFNFLHGNLDHLHEMLTDENALFGLGDGGAHVGTVCDASFTTTLLTHWTRDRRRGPKLAIEKAVAMMTSAPASHLGLGDRGVISLGRRADLNVIDLAALCVEAPRVVRDLPAGGRRFLQGARGYRATVLAGRITQRDGSLTGDRPGGLVRAA